MNAPRDRGADELVLRSLHTAQQRVARAALAVTNYRAAEAAGHLVAAQRVLVSIEKALSWPGGKE